MSIIAPDFYLQETWEWGNTVVKARDAIAEKIGSHHRSQDLTWALAQAHRVFTTTFHPDYSWLSEYVEPPSVRRIKQVYSLMMTAMLLEALRDENESISETLETVTRESAAVAEAQSIVTQFGVDSREAKWRIWDRCEEVLMVGDDVPKGFLRGMYVLKVEAALAERNGT